MFKDKLDKLAKQRAGSDSVDKMIERGKSMAPKPFKREPDYPDRPEKAAPDATATNPMRRKQTEDRDDELVNRVDSITAADKDQIRGGEYYMAKERQKTHGNVLTTMDKHGVEDIVRNLAQKRSK